MVHEFLGFAGQFDAEPTSQQPASGKSKRLIRWGYQQLCGTKVNRDFAKRWVCDRNIFAQHLAEVALLIEGAEKNGGMDHNFCTCSPFSAVRFVVREVEVFTDGYWKESGSWLRK